MTEELRRRAGVQRDYRNAAIAVHWEPKYCIHAGNCLRGLPEVFDVEARPWIDVDRATADRIAEVVMTCPTGALSFERLDGGPQERGQSPAVIHERRNGPLYVRGHFELFDPDGHVLRKATRVALCRCGHSAIKPFCDATHRRLGFRTDQELP